MRISILKVAAAILILSLLTIQPGYAQEEVGYNKFVREVLPNGLTLIIKYNPDSRVYAINILGKNRSACEPEGKDGITDFVNRMLTQGADGMDAETVQNKLDDLGATITANDNPYIPYDDRYTTNTYSFIKFETIDEYAEAGTKLLYQIVAKPDFPESEIEKTRQRVMGMLGMSSGSTYQIARKGYYSKLFEGYPLSKTVMGSHRTVAGFTRDDLVNHHRHFYAPNNMIMAIATNIEPETIKAWIYETFKQMQRDDSEYPSISNPGKPSGIIETHHEMEKEQIYIYMGSLTPGLKSPDAPAIAMASSIISTRMRLNLREKQGLAYSVGMGANFMPDFGWTIVSMGTGFENYEVAKNGLIAEIDKVKVVAPEEGELTKAQNSTWGSMLLARASRINQAYYMCKNEFLGVGYDYEDDYLTKVRQVTTADVQRVVKDYFDTKNMVISTAGKLGK
ncbi:MAG: pitrilysin family protein [candidate division Zixibacteria bacterium]